jgi:hypothetical protein
MANLLFSSPRNIGWLITASVVFVGLIEKVPGQ